jgi:hypothetical protein
VKHVSATSRVPGEWKSIPRVRLKKEGSTAELHIAYTIAADKEFLSTYDIELQKGRNFRNNADTLSVIINKAAAKILGITDVSDEIVIPDTAPNQFFTPVYDDGMGCARECGDCVPWSPWACNVFGRTTPERNRYSKRLGCKPYSLALQHKFTSSCIYFVNVGFSFLRTNGSPGAST